MKQQGQQGGHPFNPQDIFSEFFGGGGGGGGFHFNFGGDGFGFGGDGQEEEDFKGDDIHIPLHVNLEDLYNGKAQLITRIRTAHPDGAEPKKCECRNRSVRMTIINGVMKKVVENNCPECKDRFETIQKTSDLRVEIEKGMKDGDTIVFYGEGDASSEYRAGDLVFIIQAAQHSIFMRKGDDLLMKLKISLKEALSGFSKSVKHLDGKQFKIESDFVIKPGYVMQLAGKGMPKRDSASEHGNLFVEFDIAFPDDLTESQKDTIRKTL